MLFERIAIRASRSSWVVRGLMCILDSILAMNTKENIGLMYHTRPRLNSRFPRSALDFLQQSHRDQRSNDTLYLVAREYV